MSGLQLVAGNISIYDIWYWNLKIDISEGPNVRSRWPSSAASRSRSRCQQPAHTSSNATHHHYQEEEEEKDNKGKEEEEEEDHQDKEEEDSS